MTNHKDLWFEYAGDAIGKELQLRLNLQVQHLAWLGCCHENTLSSFEL